MELYEQQKSASQYTEQQENIQQRMQSKPRGVEPLSTNSRDIQRQKKLLASVQVV